MRFPQEVSGSSKCCEDSSSFTIWVMRDTHQQISTHSTLFLLPAIIILALFIFLIRHFKVFTANLFEFSLMIVGEAVVRVEIVNGGNQLKKYLKIPPPSQLSTISAHSCSLLLPLFLLFITYQRYNEPIVLYQCRYSITAHYLDLANRIGLIWCFFSGNHLLSWWFHC